MGTRIIQKHVLRAALIVGVAAVPPAYAQSAGLAQAVVALSPDPISASQSRVDSRLYGAMVDALITDANGNLRDFAGVDSIALTLSPRTGTTPGLSFRGSRPEFDRWVRDNASAILALLFPASISSAVSGLDAGQFYSQQLLLTTALGTEASREESPNDRSLAGGLFEFEWLQRADRREGDSAWAWQSLYQINRDFSVQGRFAQQREDVLTHTTTAAVDYHPYVELARSAIWRVGATARTGFLYSGSEAMNLGSLDFGGGGWMSVRRNFKRVRVGGGSVFQGTRSWVPSSFAGDEFSFLADAINERGIQYDLTYGGTLGVDTSARTAVIVKYLETRAVHSEADRPPLKLGLFGVSYAVGPYAAVDFGYKVSSTAGLRAQSLFAQGNFGW